MKTTLKIIVPPMIGFTMVWVSFEALFASLSGTSIAFDLNFHTFGKNLAFTLTLFFLIQALAVFKMPRLIRIKKIVIINILIGLLAFAFEIYAVNHSINRFVIGAGVFTFILVFYCLGNTLTLLAIKIIGDAPRGNLTNPSAASE